MDGYQVCDSEVGDSEVRVLDDVQCVRFLTTVSVSRRHTLVIGTETRTGDGQGCLQEIGKS